MTAVSGTSSHTRNPLLERRSPLIAGFVDVLAVERPTPRLARLTLGGPGDETALPSIAATIEQLPIGHRVLAFVEVADALEEQLIRSAADVELVWVHRDGEALAVRDLREHLRDDRGCEIGVAQALGYWKHRDTPDDVE